MNIELLKESTEVLEQILLKYSTTDKEAAALLFSLDKLLNDVKQEKVTTPLEWRDIPGTYFFTEGGLRQYSDLEKSFSEFKIQITGGESSVLRNLRLSNTAKT
jgi:hypothetical protein